MTLRNAENEKASCGMGAKSVLPEKDIGRFLIRFFMQLQNAVWNGMHFFVAVMTNFCKL